VGEDLQISDFDYHLPEELIAQEPSPRRDQARLLVVDRRAKSFTHRHVYDLPELLRPGDLLVFNNSRVIPARLYGERATTGGKWEGLYLRTIPDPQGTGDVWELLAHTRGYIRAGELVELLDRDGNPSPFMLQITGRTDDKHLLVRPVPDLPPVEFLEQVGHIPIPPYIRKGVDHVEDRERYQTVYAQEAGSVAAPTAGLHFTPELLEQLKQRGVETAQVTLHVGYGTFQPVKVENLAEHRMHEEWARVPEETVQAINACRSRDGRVVAVGTTTARALEAAVQAHPSHELQPWVGQASLFIRPPYTFRTFDTLLTNFHLPRSTLLMLVSAFAGRELTLAAYAQAVRQKYRFFSYGDAMLID
jgi:S-adenosylmethionine:tRNA ribosyltransferase-isomerase